MANNGSYRIGPTIVTRDRPNMLLAMALMVPKLERTITTAQQIYLGWKALLTLTRVATQKETICGL